MTGNDNFPCVLYIHGAMDGSDDSVGNLIKNNRLHDNIASAGYGPGNTDSSLVMTYYEKDTIYENNEFYNSIACGLSLKSAPENVTVRYNFFHDNNVTGIFFSEGNMHYGGPLYIYQNVFSNTGGLAQIFQSGTYKVYIYNNSIFNTAGNNYGLCCHWIVAATIEFFNNLIQINTNKYAIKIDENWGVLTFDYLDHNVYYATAGNFSWYINYSTVATSLSGWQTWLTKQGEGAHQKEENSSTSNPNFLNASGSFNTPTDFKRSSYPADGRGSSWPSVRGAYITGNEIIGPSAGLPPPDTTPPDPPQNPTVIK